MAAGATIPPMAAITAVAAFDIGCSAPWGAVASTISFAARAKKRVIPISLTTKRVLRANETYPSGAAFAHISAAARPIGSRSELLTMSAARRRGDRCTPSAYREAHDLCSEAYKAEDSAAA